MKTLESYATVLVEKTDNGYNGVIVSEDSSRGLYDKGDSIFNRKFHPFPKGTIMQVVIKFTAKRRMVKSVRAYDEDAMVRKSTPKDSIVVPGEDGYSELDRAIDLAIERAGGPDSDLGRKILEELATAPEKVKKSIDKIREPEASKSLDDWVKAMLEEDETEEGMMEEPEGELTPADMSDLVSNVKIEPIPTSGYYVNPEQRLVFNTALGMSLRHPEKAVKLMMVGPSGYGKTTLPRLFAQLTGKRFLRMNCATVRDPEEWFGYREAQDGSTVFVRSQFAQALEKGNLVVVLDEFNRLEPWLHNTLFPLLDDDGATVVHDEQFKIGPGVIVVGTINTGYRYTGTFELDEALMNRFEFILEVGPMPTLEEVKVLIERTNIDEPQAKSIVRMANTLRQNDIICSTRSTLLMANMVTAGLQVREAFETAVVKRIPADMSGETTRKKIVDMVNVEFGPMKDRSLEVDVFEFGSTNPEEQMRIVRHKLTLVLANKGKFEYVRLLQLVRNLNILGPKMSMSSATNFCQDIAEGETKVLELEDAPEYLEEFEAAGVSASYTTVAA